ncbi:MAG TPA: glycosyltransferase [Acidimicrobiia bacterium]|nr:glycosyltransferase [Acidimicrobiia bacterium]
MRVITPENDYRPVTAIAPGAPRLTVTVVVAAPDDSEPLQRTLDAVASQRGYPKDLVSVETLDIGTVRRETGERSRARNLGARHADGDVLLFLDTGGVPAPDLVARHLDWHHRSDGLVVVGPVEDPDGPDPERRAFLRRTADLRHGAEGFRGFTPGNVSLGREAFVASGGFAEDLPDDEAEIELGYRLFTDGLLLVHDAAATVARPGGAQPGAVRSARIPHRFSRSPADRGPFPVPKVSVVVAPAAGRRRGELLQQLQAQTTADWEAWFPLDHVEGDPRLRRLPDAAGDDDSRVLRAIAAAGGEYVAVLSGSAAPAPDALALAVAELDAVPRAGRVTTGIAIWVPAAGLRVDDPETAARAWGFTGLPVFSMARRRDWNKLIEGPAGVAGAWRALTELTRPVVVERNLITVPEPAGSPPGSLSPLEDESTAPRPPSPAHRVRAWFRRGARRVPIAVIGDDRSQRALRTWAGSWARLVEDRSARALVLAGATLDAATWEEVWPWDHPRRERIAVGVTAGAGPSDEWADFLATCVAVGAATEADAAILRRWGVADAVVSGHPAGSADALALLDTLVEAL